MNTIKVLLFPYSSDPIVTNIENNIYSFMQVIEGKVDSFELDDNYTLMINRSYDAELERFKYQDKYNIYGNFLVLKRNNDEFISLTDDEIPHVLKNIKNALKLEA